MRRTKERRRTGTRVKSQDGFTLIEVMVVLIIIGILAMRAQHAFGGHTNTAIEDNMMGDLNGLRVKAEEHKYRFYTYPGRVQASGTESATNMNFAGSPGVVFTITNATATQMTITATHPQAAGRTCTLVVSATTSTHPECTGTPT
jgi:prepilin-type N-terminal cleavage/methylation domain-containing protein